MSPAYYEIGKLVDEVSGDRPVECITGVHKRKVPERC